MVLIRVWKRVDSKTTLPCGLGALCCDARPVVKLIPPLEDKYTPPLRFNCNMTTTPILRELLTFADEQDEKAACSRISVRGDATYCIKGPVCGVTADGLKQVQGACPSKDDGAIGHCLVSSRSFATGCIAPVDAHCVLSATGDWECVFPVSNGSAATGYKSQDAGNATEAPSGSTTTPVASLVPLSARSSASDGLALSASTQYTKAASESELQKMEQAPSAALNVVVGASCCILALVGLVLAKKRRSGGSMLSSSDSAIMTL